MALLELAAVFSFFSARTKKWLAGIGLAAFLLAVFGEVIDRKYEHRKDALYDDRDSKVTEILNGRIDQQNQKMQELQTQNKIAGEKVAGTERKVADAEAVAKTAQAEAGKLREQNKPRVLTQDQKQKLDDYLSQHPVGVFEIDASINESDARPYAEQFATIFRKRGWTVTLANSMFAGPDTSGIWLTVQSQNAPLSAVYIDGAFNAAGIEHRNYFDPTMADSTKVVLAVGFKPKAK